MKQSELERKLVFTMLNGDANAQERIFTELEPEHFTVEEARKVFVISSALHAKENIPVDFAMIQPRTDAKTNDFIQDIIQENPFVTRDQINKYIDEIDRLKRCRDAATAARSAVKALENGDESAIYELLNRLELNSTTNRETKIVPLSDAINEALSRMGDKTKTAIKTGFLVIDDYFDGVSPGRLAILAAETGAGKSAFAANLAWNVAKSGGTVLYISLEMPCYRIANRIIANITGIDKDSQERAVRRCDVETLARITEANELVKEKNLVIHDGKVTPQQIRNLIKQTKVIYGSCDLVIIDYLQLMQPQKKADTREREVASFSAALVDMAIKENTCIFALSQVNRKVEERNSNRLFLSDIRESSVPAQDASGVFLLYQEDGEEKSETICHYQIEIAKNRDYSLTHSSLIFNKPLQRFTDEITN